MATKNIELSVASLAALAKCAQSILESHKSNDNITLVIALGELAKVMDTIPLGKRKQRFVDLNLPDFIDAVAELTPRLAEDNRAQFARFAPAVDRFGEAMSELDASLNPKG